LFDCMIHTLRPNSTSDDERSAERDHALAH
jgi:hypothetical protein